MRHDAGGRQAEGTEISRTEFPQVSAPVQDTRYRLRKLDNERCPASAEHGDLWLRCHLALSGRGTAVPGRATGGAAMTAAGRPRSSVVPSEKVNSAGKAA